MGRNHDTTARVSDPGRAAGTPSTSTTAPMTPPTPGSLGAELVTKLRRRFPESRCTYAGTLPPRPARHAPWPEWVHPAVRRALSDRGVANLYTHQATAADAAFHGRDVVVATGTSSGKSLCYQLPVLTCLAEDPTACALYITPTRALGSDQLAATMRLLDELPDLPPIDPAPYDGDTPMEARAGIRDRSRWVFTTPDMLHASVLANHPRWVRILRHLRYVIIDECHTYRGVFGAGVALVLRRLQRLAASYGSDPVFMLASATSADPTDQAERLTGRPALAVTEDGAPTGRRTVLLWEPGIIEGAEGEGGAPVRRAASTEAADIMATLVAEGARTLTFVRSRRAAEVVALRCAESLGIMGRPDFARRVRSYRAGYLAEDRRALERALDTGELLGVATTNALELGIDVGALDATITAGFPGTVASLNQQAGRAGRRGQESIVLFVARDEPLDNYLVNHPEVLLGRPLEHTVFDPQNPYVLTGHMYCAAIEKPVSDAEVSALGAENVMAELQSRGLVRHRPRGWFPTPLPAGTEGLSPETAHQLLGLRGDGPGQVLIADATDGRLLGTIEASRAPAQAHPGAVYLHQGESFVIDDLDLDELVALAHPEQPEYTTSPRSTTTVRITSQPDDDHVVNAAPGLWISAVDVEVTDQVTGFVVRLPDGTVAQQVPLDMPPQTLRTRAVAYTVDPLVLDGLGITDADRPGALHAAEHAAIGMLPLVATCDRWDLGGLSAPEHPDTGLPTVFMYDGYSGGAGFADCGFAHFGAWMRATYEAVRDCECEAGCPACVQSPKCGNGNQPLDKAGAVRLLGHLYSACA